MFPVFKYYKLKKVNFLIQENILPSTKSFNILLTYKHTKDLTAGILFDLS